MSSRARSTGRLVLACRREDLELLIRHLLQEIGRERGRALRLAPPASRALLTYPWPGNVRELKNALEYATTVCEGQTIHVGDLPREVGLPGGAGSGLDAVLPVPAQAAVAPVEPPTVADLDAATLPSPTPSEPHEVRRIRAALEQAHYRRAEAASLLGMSRTTLWRKMRELGI